MAEFASISFFHFKGFSSRWWAFKQMQLAREQMARVEGSSFMKLMGCGNHGGFSLLPDLGTYALFSVWDEESHYRQFLKESALMTSFESQSKEHFHILLKPYQSHGTWSGIQPFRVSDTKDASEGYIAVLTRATIRRSRMVSFWKLVPSISRFLQKQSGLLFSKGMGEWPLFELTTFSVWQSSQAMKDFAYGSRAHLKAVKHTKQKGLFAEDLFARFLVCEMHGIWEGKPVSYYRAIDQNTHVNANFVQNQSDVAL
jgi:heme-degrading monooxygenase HmoA